MKNYILVACVALLSACISLTPIPQDIKEKIAVIPVKDLPRAGGIEKMRCPKSRYTSLNKYKKCITEVRRNHAAITMMNAQKEQAKQNMTKEQQNETVKN